VAKKRRDGTSTGWRRDRATMMATLVERQVRSLIGSEADRLSSDARFQRSKDELLDVATGIVTLVDLLPDDR
jgi:hypothetical protein